MEKAAFEDAILSHGAELRPVQDEVGTRSMYEVVRYYGHWKKCVRFLFSSYASNVLIPYSNSSKLGEENRRIKTARSSGLDLPARPPSRTTADDEDSIIHEPPKSHQICSSCRTRESTTWWKAPKAVHPRGVLCDNCGISWRKYGELSARPMREEILPKPATKPVDKREGTPLAAPNVKRQRVRYI